MWNGDKRTYGNMSVDYRNNYSGYIKNGKPDGLGTVTDDDWWDEYGQWSDGKRHGVILTSQSKRGFDYPHFYLGLYRQGEKVSSVSFSNMNSDNTPGDSYYWGKIKSEIHDLPNDDYESSQRYYDHASSYLRERQEIINNAIERERSRREAEAEAEQEREREREAEEYRDRQGKKLEWARMYGSESDVKHYEDELKKLDGDNGCRVS